MSKKKHKKHGGGEHGQSHGDDRAGIRFDVPPQIAGIAAMVAGQVASPAGRKMIAGALNAAADAIAGRDARASAPVPSTPPVPPVPPEPPVPPVLPEPPVAPEPRGAYTPQFETPAFTLPPEATRAIGAAASALERWAQGLGKPRPPAS